MWWHAVNVVCCECGLLRLWSVEIVVCCDVVCCDVVCCDVVCCLIWSAKNVVWCILD